MIIAAIAFGDNSLGISVLERTYPEKVSKLITDRLAPGRRETDQAWYTRVYTWTTGVLRQHRPASVYVELSTAGELASVLRGVTLVAAQQSGSPLVPFENVNRSLRAIRHVTREDGETYVRRVIRLRGKIAPELFRSSAMALARLVEVPSPRLKEEAFDFDKTTRGPKRGEVFA